MQLRTMRLIIMNPSLPLSSQLYKCMSYSLMLYSSMKHIDTEHCRNAAKITATSLCGSLLSFVDAGRYHCEAFLYESPNLVLSSLAMVVFEIFLMSGKFSKYGLLYLWDPDPLMTMVPDMFLNESQMVAADLQWSAVFFIKKVSRVINPLLTTAPHSQGSFFSWCEVYSAYLIN